MILIKVTSSRGGGVAMDCRGVDCMCVTLLEVYS